MAVPSSAEKKRGALAAPKNLERIYRRALASARRTGAPTRMVVEVAPDGTTTTPETGGDALDRALAAARARGAVRVAEILSGEDMASTDALASMMGVTRETAHAKRRRGEVLGLEGAKRGVRFPIWQLGEDGRPLEGMAEIIRILGPSWAAYQFLTAPFPSAEGAPMHEMLRRGRTEEVLSQAMAADEGVFT